MSFRCEKCDNLNCSHSLPDYREIIEETLVFLDDIWVKSHMHGNTVHKPRIDIEAVRVLRVKIRSYFVRLSKQIP